MSDQGPSKLRRIRGLVRKEFLQVVRDPSSILIAAVLPVMLLFLYGFAVSLDLQHISVALVVEQPGPEADSFAASFTNSRYFSVHFARRRAQVEEELVSGRVKGVVVLAADFAERLARGDTAPIQVLVDGSDPNTAGLVLTYVQGLWQNWVLQEAVGRSPKPVPQIAVEARFWYNPELSSHNSLVPGSVAIIMALIGSLLTALVVAREWERGTMEALLATPMGVTELLLGKLVPYFVLGMGAMALATVAAVTVFGVPFRGSVLALVLISAAFLVAMLMTGLLISTATRNQFAASQAALLMSYMPAFLLSGFLFEINSMPWPIQLVTYALPPRYYVSCLQTLFLAGDVPEVLVPNGLALAAMAALLFVLVARTTRLRLE